jgi:hypothetical protein
MLYAFEAAAPLMGQCFLIVVLSSDQPLVVACLSSMEFGPH